MPDRKIKPHHHPAKSFLKSPLSLYFLAPSCLSGYESIMQNKPNFKMGNINISTAKTKAYAKEQRTMNNEHSSKQTQSNPIHHGEAGFCPCPNRHTCPNSAPHFPSAKSFLRLRNTRYAIRNTLHEIRHPTYETRAVLIYTSGRGSSPARSRITGVMLSHPIGIR